MNTDVTTTQSSTVPPVPPVPPLPPLPPLPEFSAESLSDSWYDEIFAQMLDVAQKKLDNIKLLRRRIAVLKANELAAARNKGLDPDSASFGGTLESKLLLTKLAGFEKEDMLLDLRETPFAKMVETLQNTDLSPQEKLREMNKYLLMADIAFQLGENS